MNLSSWLSYIESLHPNAIDLGLERVKHVFNALDLATSAQIITITGTNGKGTTVATLESIYRAAGYQVAAYTSPHLLQFNERIRLNGHNVTDDQLCQAFVAIEKARGAVALTYFEFTTLAAFWIFAQQPRDVWILEVGMGGRLDAVNILEPAVAVITNIALDHQEWLGGTREMIAQEKLGIARAGKPLVYGETNAPAGFLEQVKKRQIPLFQIKRDFDFSVSDDNGAAPPTWQWQNHTRHYTHLFLAPFIVSNLACALQVIDCLQSPLPVAQKAIEQGLKEIQLSARCQIISQRPWQVIDVAHNPHSSQYLAEFIDKQLPQGKVKAIFSALNDKDIDGIVAPLLHLVKEWFVAGLPHLARGSSAEKIAAVIRKRTATPVFKFDHVAQAYQAALQQASEDDNIVVFGSFYTVAEVLVQRELA